MKKTAPYIEPRAAQQTPKDLVDDLMAFIRNQFCDEIDRDAWFRRNRPFILARVVLWPARFITKKGFTISPERYKEIMYEIFKGVQQCGDTGRVAYWPAYLAKCVQSHWEKRWVIYYEESKTVAPTLAAALQKLAQLPRAPEPNKIEQLAAAQKLLSTRLTHRRPSRPVEKQLPLFG